jgi:4-hydroxy-tetrahydrodipicolinate synthase
VHNGDANYNGKQVLTDTSSLTKTFDVKGSIVALVTPMKNDGQIDWAALEALLEWHLESGTAAIGAVGTTGESATLTVPEHCEVIGFCARWSKGRIPILAGTGANSTREAIELSLAAVEAGADACLSVTPYYNKPTQAGMIAHFTAIADAVSIPQVLYNVPGRTSVDLTNDSALILFEHPRIVAIKDATGDVARGADLIARAPKHVSVYSGDDGTAAQLIMRGGAGNISVTANVIPQTMAHLCQAALNGDKVEVDAISERIHKLNQALFLESNPIPVKWALAHIGRIGAGIRLPLTPLSEQYHAELTAALDACKENS